MTKEAQPDRHRARPLSVSAPKQSFRGCFLVSWPPVGDDSSLWSKQSLRMPSCWARLSAFLLPFYHGFASVVSVCVRILAANGSRHAVGGTRPQKSGDTSIWFFLAHIKIYKNSGTVVSELYTYHSKIAPELLQSAHAAVWITSRFSSLNYFHTITLISENWSVNSIWKNYQHIGKKSVQHHTMYKNNPRSNFRENHW